MHNINVYELLIKKGLLIDFFIKGKFSDLTLDSKIEAHVTRVLSYLRPLYKFFTRYDQNINISTDDLKFLELSALFHDSGREGDGEDLWEHDSATLFYFYLTRLLEVPHEKAKFFSEVILNKDYKQGGKYYYIDSVEADNIIFAVEDNSQREKTIYQKLLHDADCLDIIRARDKFDAAYLDFYNDYVKKDIEDKKNEIIILYSENNFDDYYFKDVIKFLDANEINSLITNINNDLGSSFCEFIYIKFSNIYIVYYILNYLNKRLGENEKVLFEEKLKQGEADPNDSFLKRTFKNIDFKQKYERY